MIIVLLLLFQSLCLYCQRLVLHIHDRWINPKNARLLQEVAETVGDRKALQRLQEQQLEQSKRQNKRRLLEPFLPLGAGANVEACRFCANSPQGYCRHHFHLQELQVHKQQQRQQKQLLPEGQDYRQLRRIKRELKRSLNQRLNQQQQQTQNYQQYCQLNRAAQPEVEVEVEEEEEQLTTTSSGFVSLEEQSELSPTSSPSTCSTYFEQEPMPEEEEQQQQLPLLTDSHL